MIVPTMPILTDPNDQEEVRKALLELARQLNIELDVIRASITP